MPTKKTATKPDFVIRSAELPATQGMLQLVRTEVKADIRSLRSEMSSGFKAMEARFEDIDARFESLDARFESIDARFESIDARFETLDARFESIDAKFARVDSRFDSMDSKIEKLTSEVSRVALIVEEQNANNRVALEALTGLWQRQERVESRMDGVEELVRSIARSKA